MGPGPLHGPLFVCFSRKLLIQCYFCLRWAPLHLTFAQLPHTILSPWWREQAACFDSPLGQPPASLSTGTHSWGKAPLTAVFTKSHSSLCPTEENDAKFAQFSSAAMSPEQRCHHPFACRIPLVVHKEGTDWQKGMKPNVTCLNYKSFSISPSFSEPYYSVLDMKQLRSST